MTNEEFAQLDKDLRLVNKRVNVLLSHLDSTGRGARIVGRDEVGRLILSLKTLAPRYFLPSPTQTFVETSSQALQATAELYDQTYGPHRDYYDLNLPIGSKLVAAARVVDHFVQTGRRICRDVIWTANDYWVVHNQRGRIRCQISRVHPFHFDFQLVKLSTSCLESLYVVILETGRLEGTF